jgi:formamidopyrimidine-DNA glycosylase
MPELPEVETTTKGIRKTVVGKIINLVWSNYQRKDFKKTDEIKNLSFFNRFKKQVLGKKITGAERRGKNILIQLEDDSVILVHMKMTGHFLFGEYKKTKDSWTPKDPSLPIANPFSRHIRFILGFSDGTHLALSDMRKFAKITHIKKEDINKSSHLKKLGPDVLSKSFTQKTFEERLKKKPSLPIKTALMEQDLFTGIGNIYSDELLWLSGVKPSRAVSTIKKPEMSTMFKHLKPLLKKGISFQGDSTSDYRKIDGTQGGFQAQHNAYRRTGEPCRKKGCSGVILRKVIRGRSAHYCSKHQK